MGHGVVDTPPEARHCQAEFVTWVCSNYEGAVAFIYGYLVDV
jgi:hypothetical protein